LLDNFFPAPVKLSADNKGKGKIIITFKSEDDLQKIIRMLDQNQ